MRVLFFSEQFWPETNAPAIHVFERARLWVRAGHQVTVVTSAPNFPEGRLHPGYSNAWRQIELVEGIRVLRVKTFISANSGTFRRALDYVSYAISALLFSLGERPADVVISTSPQLLVPLAGWLHARLRGIPHVFELRDLWPASIAAVGAARPGLILRLLERLELFLYRRSARVIAFTKAFKDDLVGRGIAEQHVTVIPNGTDLSIFTPRERDSALLHRLGLVGRFVVGYVGTLGLAHGLRSVLAAAKALEDTPVAFLLVGAGAAQEDLEREARGAGLANVLFLPRQPRESMPAFWSVCDVALVHLKDTDVFRTVIPSKLYEAVAMGVPILYAGPKGEASALVERTGVGHVLPAEDPKALAADIRALWQSDGAMKSHQVACHRVRNEFSRELQAERTILLLSQVLIKND